MRVLYTAPQHDNDSYDDQTIRDYYSGQYRFDSLKSGVAIHGGRNTYLRSIDDTAQIKPQISFIFLIKGDLQFSLGKQDYCFTAGEQGRCIMLSLNDSIRFRRVTFAGQSHEKVVLRGMERWFADTNASLTLSKAVYRQAVRDWPLTANMRQGCEAWLADANDKDPLHKDMLGMKLLNISWQHFIQLELGQVSELELRLQTLLEQGVFDVQQMADALHMSTRTLQRRAVEQLGKPLGAWVTEHRLMRAKQLMVEEKKSIAEAAWLVGYQHSSSFIHAFRRAYGITPKIFIEGYQTHE
ncbi:hypothetical protein OA79_17300 [Marinomonas sp. TW1]|nr:hypothetical protein OA79_17300 [Marinomonas sp. TW1]